MKTPPYMTFLFGIMVFLSGFMKLGAEGFFFPYFLEILMGGVLFFMAILMMKGRLYSFWIAGGVSCICFLYYGIFFYKTNEFLTGILAGVSLFVIILQIVQIGKNYGLKK